MGNLTLASTNRFRRAGLVSLLGMWKNQESKCGILKNGCAVAIEAEKLLITQFKRFERKS